jgi:hypothetical protein
MRPALPPDELDALLARCRSEPSLGAVRDLVDRPDAAVQALLAEPWALPWLERLFDEDAVLRAARAGMGPGSEWVEDSGPTARAPAPAASPPEASFFAQSLLYALSHHPSTSLARRVASVLTGHPDEQLRLAACRTIERWGRGEHEPWLREAFGDPSANVRRRALRAVMAHDVTTAYDRIGAQAAVEAADVARLRDLLHVVGRDADRRFVFERVGLRDADARWLELGLSFAKSRDRELRADAEYAILGAPKEALDTAKARVAAAGKPSKQGKPTKQAEPTKPAKRRS